MEPGPKSVALDERSAARVKRSVGCKEVGATVFAVGNATFDILCDTSWSYDDLYLNYTVDFATCIIGCAMWNTQMAGKCAGVSWQYGIYGPLGEAGGSICYYLWVFKDRCPTLEQIVLSCNTLQR
jgi:hypothetical protein